MATRRCWHCDAISHMTVVTDGSWIQRENGEWIVQGTFRCDECQYFQIAHVEAPQETQRDTGHASHYLATIPEEDWRWWPQVGISRTFEDVPSHIAEAASEAHRCFSIQAYRATASLARAVVEATAKEKGIAKGQISAKIDELYAKDHIREHVRDAAHEIRYLGNEAAHGDFVNPLTHEEAQELLELMSEVLLEVFQSPARVARRRAAREARKAGDA